MEKNKIVGYEPLVNDLKQLIQKKQYRALQMINSETINLYWEIGEEIYRQQKEKGWGKSNSRSAVQGITEGISWIKRLLSIKSLENA